MAKATVKAPTQSEVLNNIATAAGLTKKQVVAVFDGRSGKYTFTLRCAPSKSSRQTKAGEKNRLAHIWMIEELASGFA